MKRKDLEKMPPTIITLVKTVANETENTHEPVRIYVGLKRVEKKYKVAEMGGEAARTQKENIFSYRATDDFTRRGGRKFFFKSCGMAETGEGTQSDDLKERVKRLREYVDDYGYVDEARGVRTGLMLQRWEYTKMGDLLYYVAGISAKNELIDSQRKAVYR